MAGIPKRARQCETALIGRPWNLETIQAGQAALRRDYTPLSDMRASQAYRALAAENLLLKFFEETDEPLSRDPDPGADPWIGRYRAGRRRP